MSDRSAVTGEMKGQTVVKEKSLRDKHAARQHVSVFQPQGPSPDVELSRTQVDGCSQAPAAR
jgi:hypothetical protein